MRKSNHVIVVMQKIYIFQLTNSILEGTMNGEGDAFSGSPDANERPSRRDFRAMIYYDYLQGKSFQQSLSSLAQCFGDQSPSRTTVFRWYKEFQFGRTTLADDDRYGRPVTVSTEQNVAMVRSLIKEDPRIMKEQMQDTLKLSSGSLDRILHDHLDVRSRCARWVPHQLSEE